jgi:hypothetical protein
VQEIIETFLLRNLQEVFGEGDPTRRRAAIAELYTEDCVVLLPIGRYVGPMRWIASRANCAQDIQTSSIRRIVPHRLFRLQGESHGAPGRLTSRRTTRGSTSLPFAMEKFLLFTSSSTRRRHRASVRAQAWHVDRRVRSYSDVIIRVAQLGRSAAFGPPFCLRDVIVVTVLREALCLVK